MNIRPIRTKVYIKRFRIETEKDGVHLPEKFVRYNCTGIIESINPSGDLAKEGFSKGHHVIFHQKFQGIKIEDEDPDVIVLGDSDVIGKYITTADGEIVIRPRKTHVFGEFIPEEKIGLIYLPNGTKHSHKNNYLKIHALPVDNKFNNELVVGDTVLLPKGWNVHNATSKIELNGRTYLFAEIKLITNKVVGVKR